MQRGGTERGGGGFPLGVFDKGHNYRFYVQQLSERGFAGTKCSWIIVYRSITVQVRWGKSEARVLVIEI